MPMTNQCADYDEEEDSVDDISVEIPLEPVLGTDLHYGVRIRFF